MARCGARGRSFRGWPRVRTGWCRGAPYKPPCALGWTGPVTRTKPRPDGGVRLTYVSRLDQEFTAG